MFLQTGLGVLVGFSNRFRIFNFWFCKPSLCGLEIGTKLEWNLHKKILFYQKTSRMHKNILSLSKKNKSNPQKNLELVKKTSRTHQKNLELVKKSSRSHEKIWSLSKETNRTSENYACQTTNLSRARNKNMELVKKKKSTPQKTYNQQVRIRKTIAGAC